MNKIQLIFNFNYIEMEKQCTLNDQATFSDAKWQDLTNIKACGIVGDLNNHEF